MTKDIKKTILRQLIIKLLIGCTFLTALVTTFIYIWGYDAGERSNKETIKAIQRRHKHYRDSIDQVIKLKNDSLEIAFTTIRIQSERIRSTEQQVIKLQKRHENIPFVTHRTDSARVRSLSELYPSYGKD